MRLDGYKCISATQGKRNNKTCTSVTHAQKEKKQNLTELNHRLEMDGLKHQLQSEVDLPSNHQCQRSQEADLPRHQ